MKGKRKEKKRIVVEKREIILSFFYFSTEWDTYIWSQKKVAKNREEFQIFKGGGDIFWVAIIYTHTARQVTMWRQ